MERGDDGGSGAARRTKVSDDTEDLAALQPATSIQSHGHLLVDTREQRSGPEDGEMSTRQSGIKPVEPAGVPQSFEGNTFIAHVRAPLSDKVRIGTRCRQGEQNFGPPNRERSNIWQGSELQVDDTV